MYIYMNVYMYIKQLLFAVSSNLFFSSQSLLVLQVFPYSLLFVCLCPLEVKYHHRTGLTSGHTS